MRDLRKIWKMMLAIALAGACSEDGGASDEPPAPTTGTVTGKWYTRCRWEGKEFDFLLDHREKVIQALVPASHSPTGYRVIEGEGYSDSTFSIPNVPLDVTYVLRLSIGYYRTDQRVIEARGEYDGRCDPLPAVAEAPTPVTFSLTGMSAYASGGGGPYDYLIIDAPGISYQSYALSEIPEAGATSLDATIDWGVGERLPEAVHGDDVRILHLRNSYEREPLSRAEIFFSRILESFHAPSLTLQSGVPSSVTGAFQPGQERAFSLSIDRARYGVAHDPLIEPSGVSATLLTERGHSVFSVSWPRRPSLTSAPFQRTYLDPFPDTWQRRFAVSHQYFRNIVLPVTGGHFFLNGSRYHERVVDGALEPPSPITDTPTDALLHGFDFTRGGLVPFDGRGPINLRWQPAVGATSYRIGVHRVTSEAVGPAIAVLRTRGTSFDMPGEIFEEGAHYVFYLSAIAGSNDYTRGEILPGHQRSYTDLISGRFFFSSSCGDGVVQDGEQCDTAGESATCNADCSSASCGDGQHNATAGEACDGGSDLLGCDRDCTLAACGDGWSNYVSEDCDDGDTTDSGNGCSAACIANNVCGNSVVESAFEACDTGGESATCDGDCSAVICGDGHVNVAAGEECDDGFFNHERCSPTCQLLEP